MSYKKYADDFRLETQQRPGKRLKTVAVYRGPRFSLMCSEAEQAKLRRAYIDSVVGNLKSQLDNTYVVEGDEKKKLEKVKNRDGEPLAKPDKPN